MRMKSLADLVRLIISIPGRPQIIFVERDFWLVAHDELAQTLWEKSRWMISAAEVPMKNFLLCGIPVVPL